MTDDDHDCCVGCCIGLGIGYLLWGNDAEKIDKPTYNHIKNQPSIERIVESRQSNNFLLKQIENYQENISPKIRERLGKGKLCKFEPSCSEYAKQAITEKGSAKGILMTFNRLVRCNPFSKGGYDPIK